MAYDDYYDFGNMTNSGYTSDWHGQKITPSVNLSQVVIYAHGSSSFTGCKVYTASPGSPSFLFNGSMSGQTGTFNYNFLAGTSYYIVFTTSGNNLTWYRNSINWPVTSNSSTFTLNVRLWSSNSGSTFTESSAGTNYNFYRIETVTASTNMKINIGDSWKDITAMKINIGDTWKDVASVKINIGDSWKTVW